MIEEGYGLVVGVVGTGVGTLGVFIVEGGEALGVPDDTMIASYCLNWHC